LLRGVANFNIYVFEVKGTDGKPALALKCGAWRQNQCMALELSDSELATAATACRAMAYQEGQRAKQMENQRMRHCSGQRIGSRPPIRPEPNPAPLRLLTTAERGFFVYHASA